MSDHRSALDPEWEDGYVAARGIGLWIQPKPNRLIVTSRTAYLR